MTITGSQPLSAHSIEHGSDSAPAPRRPLLRYLAVVDGTERTNQVVDFIQSCSHAEAAIEAVVLNVQEKRSDARLRGYQSFRQGLVDDRLIREIGLPIVSSVSRRLQAAGIASTTRVEIGDPLATTLRCIASERCKLVVVGAAAANTLQRWLAHSVGLAVGASIADRLALLAPVPVVIVR